MAQAQVTPRRGARQTRKQNAEKGFVASTTLLEQFAWMVSAENRAPAAVTRR